MSRLTDKYPILVHNWTGDQSLTIACHQCDAERVIDVDEIYNEDIYLCPRDEYGKPAVCGGIASMKYTEADPCPGCGTLGFFDPNINAGCCSRVCGLQHEYATSLAAPSSRLDRKDKDA